jgi:energy-coupling factor transporter ATP-binding protein EcfA2
LPARATVAGTSDAVVRIGNSRDAPPSARTGNDRGAVVLAASGLAVSRGERASGKGLRQPRRSRRDSTGARQRASDRPAAWESGAITVLHDIDLELRAGEIVALLGANGTGKSTLLLALAGLLSPTAGTVAGARPGLIFQNPEHQFVAQTVRDEVRHGLPAGSDALVESLLAQHRLGHLAEQSPYRLSGGEKRRLSVAAMLAHDRPALLADEPTFGLDRRATIASNRAFRAAADAGRAVLFSSHDLRTVATLADRAVVVADGTIVANGPVFDVLRDGRALSRARLSPPPLIEWLLENATSDAAARRILDALDDAVPVAALDAAS